jgi:hypothetical protein
MEDYIGMLIFILANIQDAYICDILDNFDLTWWMVVNETDRIMEVYNSLDNFPEEANDTSTAANECIDHINNAIMNP